MSGIGSELRLDASTPGAVDPRVEAILQALRVTPVLPGYDHPAEPIVDVLLSASPEREMADADLIYLLSSRALAGFVRVLARCRPGFGTLSVAVHHALAAPDIQTREAAIDAAEEAGDRWIGSIVRAHAEIEGVDWLAAHARNIADVLEVGDLDRVSLSEENQR